MSHPTDIYPATPQPPPAETPEHALNGFTPNGHHAPPPNYPTEKYINMATNGWLTAYMIRLGCYALLLLASFKDQSAKFSSESFGYFLGSGAVGIGMPLLDAYIISRLLRKDKVALVWIQREEIARAVLFGLVAAVYSGDTAAFGFLMMIEAVLWLCYFHVSERVFRTFGRNLWSSRGRTWDCSGGAK